VKNYNYHQLAIKILYYQVLSVLKVKRSIVCKHKLNQLNQTKHIQEIVKSKIKVKVNQINNRM